MYLKGNELEFNLSPKQTATAITTLRDMVNELWPTASLRPRVCGPDLNPVRFQWKNPDFLLKNLDFLIKNLHVDI